MAAITVMATVERVPGRLIQERLQREYGLTISHGGIISLLHRMARAAQPTCDHLQATSRASPVIHADETGWRENGQQSQRVPCAQRRPAEAVWTVSTRETVSVSHGRRTNAAIDGILGADFGGTIVADRSAAYDHSLGPKQRCWAHLVRDLETLQHEHTADTETVAWVAGILQIYGQAALPRPGAEDGMTRVAVRAREQRARQCEALIAALCPVDLAPTRPYTTLATRLRTHPSELFTFVRDPAVAATNNAAERSLRPLWCSGGCQAARGPHRAVPPA